MRLNAILAAGLVAATLVGVGGHKAFADSGAPGKPAPYYITVNQGDYLAGIASANNSSYVRIFDANAEVQDPNLIFPGEQLRIPDPNEQLPNRPLPTAVTAGTDATTPADPSPTTTSQASVSAPVSSSGNGIWDAIAACESGGNWAADTGNGFYGGLQFTLSSWQAVGGSGYPNQASPSEQIARAQTLQSRQGWSAWPVCSVKAGL